MRIVSRLLVALLVIGTPPARAQRPAPPASSVAVPSDLRAPLPVGLIWQFEGTLRYPRAPGDTVDARVPDWRTTIVASALASDRVVAVAQDLPTDLLRGINVGERQFSVLAVSASHLWFVQSASRQAADSVMRAWLRAEPDSESMVLRAPVREGARVPDRAGKVADGFWEWTVTGIAPPPRVFAGTPSGAAIEVLRHQRLDAVTLEWTPGIGLTRVEYLHFGDQRRGTLHLRRVRPPVRRAPA